MLFAVGVSGGLWRSDNAGASWQPTSDGLTNLAINALAIDPRRPDVMYVGTGEGYFREEIRGTGLPLRGSGIFVTGDGGRGWRRLDWTRRGLEASSSIPWDSQRPREGWVTSVAIDPRDDRTMYATYGNFGGAHVFRTSDAGATWQRLDGTGESGLPDIPVHSLVVDPSDSARLYLGTDLGVFVSIDRGESWMVEETGFGPAVTEWLALQRDASGRRQLFAFTHGRGAWRVELR